MKLHAITHLPERDTSKPAEQQGLFRKFDVRRTDGSDQPGGKHHGCEYFVLDTTHDLAAPAALAAYADAVEVTHKALADDMRARYGLKAAPTAAATVRMPVVDLTSMVNADRAVTPTAPQVAPPQDLVAVPRAEIEQLARLTTFNTSALAATFAAKADAWLRAAASPTGREASDGHS